MKKLYFLLILLISLNGFSQNPGDIVITEIMNNPNAVSDTVGEWFEVYNTTSSPIDMEGWILKDDGSNTHTIEGASTEAGVGGTTVVPANGYLVLGRSSDTNVNGGAPVNYSYGEAGHTLGNSADEVVLVLPDGTTEIARVNYDGGPNFPDPTGASMQLNSGSFSAAASNDASNWCESSSTTYGSGDFGTPGAANVTCAPTCEATLGTSDATCDATTAGTDTYTATLAFSGTGTTTFVVTATAGTVGGDDPTTATSGTITVTGIPEGTDITITVDDTAAGGLCTLTRDVTSPVCVETGSVDLELKGIIDFTVPTGGSDGKAIHLVATADIADLSVYGLGSANNGGGTDGQEYTFPAQSVSNGDNILLVRNSTAMEAYLTTDGYNFFQHKIVDTNGDAANMNGDDAIELFKNGAVVETFGDINVDGTGESWEYMDTWAYKTTSGATWPTGWSYGTVNSTDGTTTIFDVANASDIYPFVASLSTSNLEIENLGLYPNPVKASDGFINLTTPSSESLEVSIFDVIGKRVATQKVTDNRLNISTLKSGLYLLKIAQGDAISTKKLIVQ